MKNQMKNVFTDTIYKRSNGNKRLYVSAQYHTDGIARVGTFKSWKRYFKSVNFQDGAQSVDEVILGMERVR